MKGLIIALIVVFALVLVVVGLVMARGLRRGYQRYTGMERQRDAAKESRVAGADRLKGAERHLISAQRDLASHGKPADAQALERLRSRLSTLADRLRHAAYGYSPVGAANPIHEDALAELQRRDAEMIEDASDIAEACSRVAEQAANGELGDLVALRLALDRLQESLDRRRSVT